MKQLFKYCLWWQLFTPLLVWCIVFIPAGVIWQAMIANFVGAVIFYVVQKEFLTKERRPMRNLRDVELIPYGLRRSVINRIKFWK